MEMAPNPIAAYSTAKGYVQSVYLLMSNPARFQVPDDTSFYLAFHMLSGFAAELYLKSFLFQKGYDEKTLRKPGMGHNLHKLYEASEAAGLRDHGAIWLVNQLGEQHKNFEFRYMRPQSCYQLTDIRKTFSAFSTLDRAVDIAVGASATYAKTPGSGWAFPEGGAVWRVTP